MMTTKFWRAWHSDTGINFAYSAEPLQSGEVEVSPHAHFSAGAIESAEQGLCDLPTLTTHDQSYWQVNGAIVRQRGF